LPDDEGTAMRLLQKGAGKRRGETKELDIVLLDDKR
jgi:hypothetical protein